MTQGAQQTYLRKEDVDDVVRELRGIHQRNGMSSLVAVGEVILRRFFGGSVSAWLDPHRDHQYSLRRLARHEGCPYSKSALHQAVRVYLVHEESPHVQTYGHVGPSHVVTVLSLDKLQREALLAAAEQGRWSVRRLRRELAGRTCTNREALALAKVRQCSAQLSVLLREFKAPHPAGPHKERPVELDGQLGVIASSDVPVEGAKQHISAVSTGSASEACPSGDHPERLAHELRRLIETCKDILEQVDRQPEGLAPVVRLARIGQSTGGYAKPATKRLIMLEQS